MDLWQSKDQIWCSRTRDVIFFIPRGLRTTGSLTFRLEIQVLAEYCGNTRPTLFCLCMCAGWYSCVKGCLLSKHGEEFKSNDMQDNSSDCSWLWKRLYACFTSKCWLLPVSPVAILNLPKHNFLPFFLSEILSHTLVMSSRDLSQWASLLARGWQ